VLHRERYQVPVNTAAEMGNYNGVLRAFLCSEGMKEVGWGDQVVAPSTHEKRLPWGSLLGIRLPQSFA
jgi:hypothetical protein